MRSLARGLFRARYVLLAAWTFLFLALSTHRRRMGLSDWNIIEYGARTLIHLNSHYDTGALALYAHFPFIQVGPPPLLAVASLQWLSPNVVSDIATGAMASMALGCVFAIERTAVALYGDRLACRLTPLSAAVIALPVWAWESAKYRHLDDAMAVTAMIWAASLVVRRRHAWLAGALLGLAVASKPWALPAAAVIVALPRRERIVAAGAAIATCGAFWAPFVLGAPNTLHALGGYQLIVNVASDLRFLGVTPGHMAPQWVRPAQLFGGFLVCLLLAGRRRVLAVPLVALAIRVVLDPQAWAYYGMGPLLAAVWYDAVRPGRLPTWTALTFVTEFVVVAEMDPLAAAIARAAWFALLLVAVCRTPADPAASAGSTGVAVGAAATAAA